ncbi:efflux RND transporter permease subunit [Frigidibacter sp. ROC022]|uniref:efflux RND transporter permease subunit n=1 Tax=Frigidibacter sp. ROC022 TaxID=2971796 RepID=UPI00215A6C45|nr:efflux RND transporter permease subunit [Frigidibacter sp. ROC022]MCR8726600.1 efflux RND transporter permease subunit [Frigidibacter sp. ROC022]
MRAPSRGVTGILSYFTRHRTAANLLLVLMLAAGLAALPRMRAQFFPDVVINEITVSVAWSGAGAEDVDSAIISVLEPALQAVEGVTASEARATEGSARLTLEFEPGWDMSRASDDVQAAVDAVSNLPDGAEDPEVRRGNWRDRVTDVVVTGPVDTAQLGRYADELVARLFTRGVTRTTISGIAAPETVVEVPSASLIRHDVTLTEIADAIGAEAAASPAGNVGSANSRIRTGVAKRSKEEIERIPLRFNPDGSTLTIGDVATVKVGTVDRDSAYFVGDNPAITVRVDRSDEGDAIELQKIVEEVAADLQTTLPQGVTLDLIRTRAAEITGRLDILIQNGLQGLALVVVLLFLFLNARTAFWVAMGIPVSMTATIALMYGFGISLNMISLFALIITTGIIVDDAIVVGEHADFRARKRKEHPTEAAENAAMRMAAPVFSSTTTTVIAFLGLVAIGGRFGSILFDIPFTVSAVLLASLIECFLILPHHMAHALAHIGERRWYDWPSRTFNRGFDWVRNRIARPLITLVIWARYPVLAGAVLFLAFEAAIFVRGDLQWRFFNSPEQPTISGNIAMLPTATREDTLAQLRELQRATDAIGAKYEAEYGVNPLSYVMTQIGGNSGRGLSGAETKEDYQLGAISIELIDPDLRPYSSFQLVADLQKEVRTLPLAETISFRGWRQGPGGDSISIDLYGADAERLKDAAEALKTALATFPEVSALEDSLAYDKDELILELTPQGHALGFTIDALGRELRNRLNGIEAAAYPDGTRSATIRVELPESELTADFLDKIRLRSASGDYVALGDIVTVTRRSGFSTIRRENGLRLVTVSGDLSEDDPARATEVQQAIVETILPKLEEEYGVQSQLGGLSQQENQFLSDAIFGFVSALTGIYLVLAWVFASWTRPVVVMAIIPFGLIGTIYGHVLWQVPLSMYSVVGMIGMTGIIINDSIVLVSTVDEYAEKRGLFPAIVDAVADRLRPVLLTTLTTVLGLAPLLYESSAQAQFLKPTVITLVYGLGFGMALVLLVVPAMLAMQTDIGRQISAAQHALRAGRRALPVALPSLIYAAAIAAWFAATLGSVLVTGEMAGPLAGLGSGRALAAGLFIAGSAAMALAIWILAAVTVGFQRLRRS